MVFRPHPQLVQVFFNRHWFGPPPRVTGGSAWPWIDHPASGPPRPTRRALRTRFRFGYANRLNLAGQGDSQTHYAKGTQSPPKGLLQFGGAWVQVLFHSPLRGSFHLSLTVLVRYRSAASVQPWRVGPPDSGGVSRVPPYLGYRWDRDRASPTGLSPSMAPLSSGSGSRLLLRVPAPQPRRAGPPVWAWSAFAHRYSRNRSFFLFLRLLRCFTSPGSRLADYLFIRRHRPRTVGCPIRTPPDQRPHASPRGFSQLAASFVACRRQGIRHAPVHPGRLKSLPGGRPHGNRAPAPPGAGRLPLPWQSSPARPRLAAPPGRNFRPLHCLSFTSLRAGSLPPLARNYSLCPSGCQRTARRLAAA